MTEKKLDWIRFLPEVDKKKTEAKTAVEKVSTAIGQLAAAASSGDGFEKKYSESVTAWSSLLNATEALGSLGRLIQQEYPEKSKYMVSGSVLELTDNLLDTADAMLQLQPSGSISNPFTYAMPQKKAFEAAQQLIAADFPDLAPEYKAKFSLLTFPTEGFGQLPARRAPEGTESVSDEVSSLNVIHISDLHRTSDEQVSNAEVVSSVDQAIADIDGGKFDLLLVSGDLTQSASESEYKEAQQFIRHFVDKYLGGDLGRCVIVPGNHDVDWSQTAGGPFDVKRGDPSRQDKEQPGFVQVPGGWIAPRAETLKQAGNGFRKWYKKLTNRPFNGCYYFRPSGAQIGFICVDSTYGMHHLCDDARVDRDALAACIDEAKADVDAQLLLAIGHHGPVLSQNQRDALPSWFFHRLIEAGVAAYIHGHLHESGVNYVSTDDSVHLPCIGVGSLVAGPKERRESTPRQYNYLKLDLVGRRGRMFVRSKDTRDKPWRKDMRFGPRADPTDFVQFRLGR